MGKVLWLRLEKRDLGIYSGHIPSLICTSLAFIAVIPRGGTQGYSPPRVSDPHPLPLPTLPPTHAALPNLPGPSVLDKYYPCHKDGLDPGCGLDPFITGRRGGGVQMMVGRHVINDASAFVRLLSCLRWQSLPPQCN